MTHQTDILFLHAHPDDETLSYGGTIADCVRRGLRVTVVTATRGERGEVIPAELHDLLQDETLLAEHRASELHAALAELGVQHHLFLGEPGARAAGRSPRRYRDSGMVWGADGHALPDQSDDTSTLTGAPLAEVADDIAHLIDSLNPMAIVIPNGFGGYGHPDHIRVHDATLTALAQVGGQPSVFAAERPHRIAVQSSDRVAKDGRFTPVQNDELNTLPDTLISVAVPVAQYRGQRRLALSRYRTQVVLADSSIRGADGEPVLLAAMSNGGAEEVGDYEYYREVTGRWRYAGEGVATDFLTGWQPTGRSVALKTSFGQTATHAIIAAPIGFVVGVVTTIGHQYQWSPGGASGPSLPVGLMLAFAAVIFTLGAARFLMDGRGATAGLAIGVYTAVGLLGLRSYGGSVLVPANLSGIVWSYGVLLVSIIVLLLPVASSVPSAGREIMRVRQSEGQQP